MSRYVAALVYRKKIGSMARKAVLAYCAERSNDDGTGVWASKLTMSKEIECSKQTVIDMIRAFVSEGIMIEAGKRKCSNGYVVEYDLNIRAIEALDDAISRQETTGPILDRSTSLTPRGQAAGPQEVKLVDSNRPKTVLKPSNEKGSDDPDLFSGNSDGEEPAPKVDPIAEGFRELWDEIWPKHPRKTGKKDCEKVYRQACTGKHPKSEKIDPDTLNAAAKRYLASVDDHQFLKGLLPWLRLPGWEPFLSDEPAERRRSVETPSWMDIRT